MQFVEFKNKKGLKIRGVIDLPNKTPPFPAVLTLHGFMGTKEYNYEWVEILNPLGIATLRIDFHGSGDSEGKFEEKTISGFIDDSISAIDYLSSRDDIKSDSLGIVGHSAGAYTAILTAAKDARVKTFVASVPGLNEGDIIANLYDPDDFKEAQKNGFVEKLKNGTNQRLNFNFFKDARRYDLITEANKILYEFLIIAALKDSIVLYL